MIRLDIRRKAYRGTEVLGPIDLMVEPGETVALLGPSGIGKSTLLRIAAGLDQDFEGRVDCPGRCAVVFQEPALLRWRSALRNITLMTGATDAVALELLEELGLSGKAGAFPGQLSLGQQRRLAVARALAHAPDVLLLDEPFASLDPDLVASIAGALRQAIRGRAITCLLVTHSHREASLLADRSVRLTGRPARLLPVAATLAVAE